METIEAHSRGEAWIDALSVLRENHQHIYNLIVEIAHPSRPCIENERAQELLEPLLNKDGSLTMNSVSETIFPAWEYFKHGTRGVYDVYPDEIYPAISDLPANRWGTYAFRLVRRVDCNGKEFNPLDTLVQKLKSELRNAGPKRAVYELDVGLGGLSTYEPSKDRNLRRGGQCLSHVSIKLGPERRVYLTALYRSQFFMQKALGNFLGLARLQDFICRQTGTSAGPLVCHATYATLDTGANGGWGLHDIDDLIQTFNEEFGRR